MKRELKNMMVFVGMIIFGAVYMLNIDKGMLVLESMFNIVGGFMAAHRELLDKIADMALSAVAVALVITTAKEIFVYVYESMQDEDSIIYIFLFSIVVVVSYVPFMVYKYVRRAIKAMKKKSRQRTKSRG